MTPEQDTVARRAEISALLKENLPTLLQRIGYSTEGRSVSPIPPDRAAESGRAWLRKHRAQLGVLICNNAEITELHKRASEHEGVVVLCAAIADLLTSYLGGVGPCVVAVLLVKEGLQGLCKKHWVARATAD